MCERDRAPNKEGRDTGQIDDIGVRLTSSSADVHHGYRAEQVREDNRINRHSTAIRLPQELGRHLFLCHEEYCSRPNVD